MCILIYRLQKDNHILLLQYIHLVLKEAFSKESSETKILHLHFEYDFNDNSLLIIAQYLLIHFFKKSSKTLKPSFQSDEGPESIKTDLRSKLRILSTCPDGASGRNGGNRVYKNWIKGKKEIQALIDFYDKLIDNSEISANALFNCQVWLANFLINLFITKPYAREIEDQNNYPTFNLLNAKLKLNQIDEIDNSIIDNLETVILFDCERKRLMQYFSLQGLRDYGIKLKKYLIITLGNKETSIQSLRDKINLIQNRFKIAQSDSYTIVRSEIGYSLGSKSKKYIPVSFIGINTSHFWDAVILETKIQDLYEIRSVKMMNLYSLCFDEEIKNYILHEMFSENHTSDFFSDDTKQKLSNLRSDDLLALKELLGNVLDLIISSNMRQVIINKTKSETIFIVDDLILKSKELRGLISSTLTLTEKNKLVAWSDFKTIQNETTLILSYRDQGKYPYYFYPNLIEAKIPRHVSIEAIFQKFLFSDSYSWAKYNIAQEIYKLTDHPIRRRYFHWERLKASISILQPQKENDTNWDLEHQYVGNSNREIIKLKLKNERERTFNSSELFIYSIDNSSFNVEKIGNIIESIDEDVKYFVHHLDEIQKNINLYAKMIDTKQHKAELNIIRQQFQIDEAQTGRLWKILLKKKILPFGEEALYDELKAYLERKGLKIVSFHHFKSNWLNPESESMAPLSKKVFIELCTFLELPKVYFILIQRLRNVAKQSNRQSTLQMNRLLQDLFNDGYFDDGADLNKIITTKLENYKRKHPLDELGIDERYLGDNLIVLVELIKPEITLKEIEKFKKAE
uniref:hypothetical protein n=1 Tax=Sphingobacterium multivorum TaxID=28454 RepID=UPI0028A0D2A5|nr:hypothetical protein [Sphingobacterium multivorum]